MKKFVFPVILGFLLLWPLRLESKRLFVKMTFGISSGGKLTDSWHLNPSYYDSTITQAENINPGMDLAFELILKIHPNISFSLGAGYVSRGITGNSGLFTPLGPNEAVENFSLNPELLVDSTPVYVTTILSFPLLHSIQLNFFGGIGYYWGNIRAGKIVENYAEIYNPSMIANRLLWKFESKTNEFGFHAGIGVDIPFSENMFFFVETLYRTANFKRFKTSVQKIKDGVALVYAMAIEATGENLGEDSTFFYAQKIREVEEWKNIDYRISQFDISGIGVRIGIKFGF